MQSGAVATHFAGLFELTNDRIAMLFAAMQWSLMHIADNRRVAIICPLLEADIARPGIRDIKLP